MEGLGHGAELLAQADHLVLVLPYSAASHHAIGAAELAQMKPGATLTNANLEGAKLSGALMPDGTTHE